MSPCRHFSFISPTRCPSVSCSLGKAILQSGCLFTLRHRARLVKTALAQSSDLITETYWTHFLLHVPHMVNSSSSEIRNDLLRSILCSCEIEMVQINALLRKLPSSAPYHVNYKTAIFPSLLVRLSCTCFCSLTELLIFHW